MMKSKTNQLGRDLFTIPVDIAIRLRWVLRDIRAGRIKLLAPSRDDLTLLAWIAMTLC
jgi:hypothetical protein